MDRRYYKIFKLLMDNSKITARDIASNLNISEKTIRNDIKALKYDLLNNGATINSLSAKGYSLEVTDEDKFKNYCTTIREEMEVGVCSNERTISIIRYLLENIEKYVKIEELADYMNLSVSSLNRELKLVKSELEKRELGFDLKHRNGIRIVGNEYQIRLCMAYYMEFEPEMIREAYDIDYSDLKSQLRTALAKNNFEIVDYSFDNLAMHVLIMISRIMSGKYISFEKENLSDLENLDEFIIANRICKMLENEYKITIPKEEMVYVTVHLAAKKFLRNKCADYSNKIDEDIRVEVDEFLNNIFEQFCLDLRNDIDLVMALQMHFKALDFRMEYGLNIKNPVLEEIKKYYQFSYIMTNNCIQEIAQRKYNKLLSEDEIAYIAIYINLSMERNKKKEKKKNILIVCAVGTGIGQMLKYEYSIRFKDSIENIYAVDLTEFKKFDLEGIDYIFSTINLSRKCNVPIFQVKPIMDYNDNLKIQKILRSESRILKYFSQELFFTRLKGKTPEEIISELTVKIKSKENIPDEFEALVLKREKFGITNLNTNVAFPHPFEPCVERSFVAIGLLDKPIKWNENKIQMVYLFALKKNNKDDDLPILFQVTSRLLSNSVRINRIVESKEYLELVNNLMEIEANLKE